VPADAPWFSHYPSNVPHRIDVPNVRLPDLIEPNAERWADRAALVYYGSRWSYRKFWELTGKVASQLAADGFGPGDRLALYLPNTPAHPIAFFGALRLGVTIVHVSPLYIGQDLTKVLTDSRPKGIVTLEILYPNLAKVASEVSVPLAYVAQTREFYPWPKRAFVNLVLRRQGRTTTVPVGSNIRPWSHLVGGSGSFVRPKTDPATEVAVYQYTGGTTGRPKAAMLSHRNLVANALQCQAWFSAQPPGTSVVLASIPFFHVYGMTVALNYPLSHGATIVLQNRPDPDEILKLIGKYHPSELPGVPALYAAISNHPKVGRYDVRSIKVCVSGSAPLPAEVAKRFEALTGGSLIEGYGLTEASPVTHANPIGGERRAGSIGLPLPLTDQRVFDLVDRAMPMAADEVGELAVRGPQVMLGYANAPEETKEVMLGDWLLTGDIARIDADGYAFIVDRKKDLVDVGGFKVYPREVEEVLYQHPAVAEAAVIGVPDARLGEVVKAFVVLRAGQRATEPELIEFVRARIAHYKAPRAIEFRTELPKSGIQKVLRRMLRDEALAATAPVREGPAR
ncbi:MAG: long-chain fatty acid--CoA ligase, partial [Thermoplasmata archaeon]|nr:long-chain fatty acid--CoA ligase [Thermoplasmata archaeon]